MLAPLSVVGFLNLNKMITKTEFKNNPTERIYSERDLVSFANYVLSQGRKGTIHRGHSQKIVYHADIENWRDICEKAQDMPIKLSENGNPIRLC